MQTNENKQCALDNSTYQRSVFKKSNKAKILPSRKCRKGGGAGNKAPSFTFFCPPSQSLVTGALESLLCLQFYML